MELYGMTDIGQKRETNQDVFYTHRIEEKMGFAIVCDGMGGQNAGHIASGIACDLIAGRLAAAELKDMSDGEIKQEIVAALSEANAEVYRRANLEPGCRGMGTTAVVAVICHEKAHVAHAGDSRLYLLPRNGGIKQLTRDHSLVQELVDRGQLTPDGMKSHPNKNMITRAIGVALTVEADYLEFPLERGDRLLLCSDGLTNMLEDSRIEGVLREGAPAECCGELVRLANEAGGNDNITVVVVME